MAREKNSIETFFLVVTTLLTSIIARQSRSASSRPSPVIRFVPCERAMTTGSCPAARTFATTLLPTSPVPPAIAIFTAAPLVLAGLPRRRGEDETARGWCDAK